MENDIPLGKIVSLIIFIFLLRQASAMNQKILVTGGDGFIGSHLVEELVRRGHEVKALCLYNSFGSYGWLDHMSPETRESVEVVLGDIRDATFMTELIKDCNTVFHLAALISIPYSYQASSSFIDTNVRGTLNVLEASKKAKVNRLLVASTSEVYGTAKYTPIDEKHPKNAQSPYAASKVAADALALSYHHAYQLPVVMARPFNTYGPRQSSRAIMSTIIQQLLVCDELKLGNLTPSRDFVYVDDTVDALIRMVDTETLIGKECNIASGQSISIGLLAEKLIKKLNPKAVMIQDQQRFRPDTSEVFELLGSGKVLQDHTAWVPKTSLEEGLNLTINWFKENQELFKDKAGIYNI